jgi:predicted  nucleic acid-binding Zn-ribbon protein
LNQVKLEHRLNNIESAITNLAEHVGKITGRLDTIEDKMDKLSKDNSQIDFLSDDISELREHIDNLECSNPLNRVTDFENIIFWLREALEVR